MKTILQTIVGILIIDLLIAGALALVIAGKTRDLPDLEGGTVLIQRIAGDILEYSPPSSPFNIGETPLTQTILLENLEKARRDKRIKAVVLRIHSPSMGRAKIDEVREQIAKLREAKKPVWAYVETLDRRALHIGSACDSLFLLPTGYVSLHGFAAERMFFAGTLEKLGIRDNLHKIEKYKAAAELTQRDSMGPEARRNLEWMLDAYYPDFLRAVEDGRDLAPGFMESSVLAQGAMTADEALAAGLVDRLIYWDEVESALLRQPGVKAKEKTPKDAPARPRTIPGDEYAKVPRTKAGIKGKKTIAVVHAQGLMAGEKSGIAFPLGVTMGAGTMEAALRQASENKKVDAIVFRIDSGGGESVTAQKINRAVVRAGALKPMVVSMNDAAASGGYSIAYPCSTIVAGRMSVVGSIGSISGKFNMRGLYEKLGITKDFVTRGPMALIGSDYFDYSPEELASFSSRHWAEYQEWVADIARYRGMSPAEVDSVGRGRVWTGEQALDRRLVDALGTFDDAIRLAKEKAGIPADQDVRIIHYPKREGPLAALSGGTSASAILAILQRSVAELAESFGSGTWMVDWNDYR